MPASWTIGADPECDLVVDLPTVSRRHCLLIRDADGFSLEDLGSSNGTYVNGQRIATRVRITRSDSITLGSNVPLPWPPDSPPAAQQPPSHDDSSPLPALTFRGEAMVIGRDPDCDLTLEVPVVSGRHARLARSGDLALLEDLGSSNGTFLNGQRIDRAVAVRPGDLIGLGSYTARFVDEPPPARPRDTVMMELTPTTATMATVPAALPGEFARTFANPGLVAVLVGQVVPVALAIAMLGGRGSGAAVLFGLGLAAVWFGLSDAILANTFDAARPGGARGPAGATGLVPRFAALGLLCVVQCVLARVIVAQVAGLEGAAGPQVALLVLASAVGLTLGLVIVLLVPGPAPSWLLVAPVMLTLWTLGGERWPVPGMAGWARLVSNAVPTRWAFEGLLLLESAGPRPAAGAPAAVDPAERYFPAASERMGVRADAIALLAMFLGLGAVAAFIAEDSRRGP